MAMPPSLPERRRLSARDLERLREAATTVLQPIPEVVAAYLYGSAARGEPARDLDIAILFRDELPPARDLERMAADLQRLGAPHGPEIDLRPLNRTAPRFRANVVREGRVLVDRDPRKRVEAEARALSEWLDFKPVWERMQREMRARWSRG